MRTSLHYAESLVPARRTTISRFPMIENGAHFPIVGRRFLDQGQVRRRKVGSTDALLFSTRSLVDFAARYFRDALTCP
jgi:aminoglycoside N3'-acetyltransferase